MNLTTLAVGLLLVSVALFAAKASTVSDFAPKRIKALKAWRAWATDSLGISLSLNDARLLSSLTTDETARTVESLAVLSQSGTPLRKAIVSHDVFQRNISRTFAQLYSRNDYFSLILLGRAIGPANLLPLSAQLLHAHALAKTGDLAGAEIVYSALSSQKTSPISTLARHCLLDVLIRLHEFDKAEKVLEELLEESPSDPRLLAEATKIYSHLGRNEKYQSILKTISSASLSMLPRILRSSPELPQESLVKVLQSGSP